ncbi:hypothetical protein [Sorangium sp. So ce406]|uniref:hypothetical protein n=1 Tax=Sorangium sp. So ce406 TaxID=3133311 RepID=UPI003F5CAD37
MRISTVNWSRFSSVSLMLAGALALGGCVASAEGSDAETPGDEADIGSTEQALFWGWTHYTSEEFAPILCDSGSLLAAVQCKGDYCDNIRAYCEPAGGNIGHTYATDYFSEEGTDFRYCNYGYWVTGITCRGDYCNDISLQCSQISNFSQTNCYWTGWVSEEGGGTLSFGSGYFMAGAQCDGDYCDSKRFYVCQAG